MFLITKKSDLKGFSLASDREFFSAPVEVELVSTDINTRLVTVRSPLQGGITYPVDPKNLTTKYHLSIKKLAAARRIG